MPWRSLWRPVAWRLPQEPPSPLKVACRAESYAATRLSSGTTFYFAGKTVDVGPNWSGISSIGSASTIAPPHGYGQFDKASGNTIADATGIVGLADMGAPVCYLSNR